MNCEITSAHYPSTLLVAAFDRSRRHQFGASLPCQPQCEQSDEGCYDNKPKHVRAPLLIPILPFESQIIFMALRATGVAHIGLTIIVSYFKEKCA
jgi:hypothetical protein